MSTIDHTPEQTPRRDAGSSAPVAEPGDLQDLRTLLDRAQERLSFYEGFDRLIAENVRRSGELMLESLNIRESMAAQTGLGADRDHVMASLRDLGAELSSLRVHLDAIDARVIDLQRMVGEPAEPITPALPKPVATEMPEESPVVSQIADTWESPKTVDVIIHGVSRAAVALSLQRYLGGLTGVAGVQAREFAEGILRLQVTTQKPLGAEDLATWNEGGRITVLQSHPQAIELELS